MLGAVRAPWIAAFTNRRRGAYTVNMGSEGVVFMRPIDPLLVVLALIITGLILAETWWLAGTVFVTWLLGNLVAITKPGRN